MYGVFREIFRTDGTAEENVSSSIKCASFLLDAHMCTDNVCDVMGEDVKCKEKKFGLMDGVEDQVCNQVMSNRKCKYKLHKLLKCQ